MGDENMELNYAFLGLENEEGRSRHQSLIEKMMEISIEPTLKLIRKQDSDFIILQVDGKGKTGKIKDTGIHVAARKVGDFSYLEEEYFHPLVRRAKNLRVDEIDTKILRFLHPNLEFDAYSFQVGQGFDPYYTHIEGELYKIGKTIRQNTK